MPDAILEVAGLTAGYTEEPIIENVAMRAERGRITGIIGPNGCGKSTFLKAIVGIVQPSAGRVLLDGVDIARLSPFQTLARGLAYIPQGRQVFADMSVHENLLMSAYTLTDRKLIQARFDEAFGRFPRLYERRHQRAGTLSGGEQSMLSFAMALVLQPSCVLLDEPSLGLAPLVTQEVFDNLRRVTAETGTAVLLVEQNANLALDFAARAYVLEAGTIVMSGPAAQLQGDEAIRSAYLGL